MNATDSQSAPGGRSGAWRWGLLAAVAAVVFVAIVLRTFPFRGPQGVHDPAVGRKLQYLQLEGLTGDAQAVSLNDLRGRVTLLNFWGTWCPPCIAEFPHLVKLADNFADQDDFRFVPVSCGSQGGDADLDELRQETEKFLQSKNVKLATYGDQNAATRQALAITLALDRFGYPTTAVLDRDGTIRGFWVGYSWGGIDEMTKLVEDLLRQPETTASAVP